MHCKKCGQKIDVGADFCKNCGTKVVKRGWLRRYKWFFITLGSIFLIIFILAMILLYFPSNEANEESNQSNSEISSQTSPPTVPSQLQDDSEDSFPSPDQQDNTSPSVTTQDDAIITASDIAPYLTAVGQVVCSKDGTVEDTGSGSIWQFSDSQQTYVLTNEHVIQGNDSCQILIMPTADDSTGGFYDLDVSSPMEWNNTTDAAAIPITGINPAAIASSTPVSELNYSISNLRYCPTNMPQESPVIVIGFPASTDTSDNDIFSTRTVTSGNVSGYDSANPDQYDDYFISAQVDSGNSGGVALSKDDNGLCLLGVPTWVSVGNYQNEGVVQDINNIFYSGTSSSQ